MPHASRGIEVNSNSGMPALARGYERDPLLCIPQVACRLSACARATLDELGPCHSLPELTTQVAIPFEQ